MKEIILAAKIIFISFHNGTTHDEINK